MLKGLEKVELFRVVFVCRERGIRIGRDSFGKRGVRNPPRRVWEREEKAFSEFPFRHRLSCGTDTVPSFLLGTGEAVVGDLDGMFKDFDGIEGIEQFGFADKG